MKLFLVAIWSDEVDNVEECAAIMVFLTINIEFGNDHLSQNHHYPREAEKWLPLTYYIYVYLITQPD